MFDKRLLSMLLIALILSIGMFVLGRHTASQLDYKIKSEWFQKGYVAGVEAGKILEYVECQNPLLTR